MTQVLLKLKFTAVLLCRPFTALVHCKNTWVTSTTCLGCLSCISMTIIQETLQIGFLVHWETFESLLSEDLFDYIPGIPAVIMQLRNSSNLTINVNWRISLKRYQFNKCKKLLNYILVQIANIPWTLCHAHKGMQLSWPKYSWSNPNLFTVMLQATNDDCMLEDLAIRLPICYHLQF